MPIDIYGFLRSITAELMAQKNRVRHFIQLRHQPSSGRPSRRPPIKATSLPGYYAEQDESESSDDGNQRLYGLPALCRHVRVAETS